MHYVLVDIMSYSIAPAAIVGLVRYRKLTAHFYPFVWFVWLALLNELCSSIVIFFGYSNATNNNIYILMEWWLLLWLFHRLTACTALRKRYLFWGLAVSVIWGIEFLIIGSITTFGSIYRICYAASLVVIALCHMHELIVAALQPIRKDAGWIICCGIALFYTYRVITELLYTFTVHFTANFHLAYFFIHVTVNTLCNIIYLIGSLCLPKRPAYILQSF